MDSILPIIEVWKKSLNLVFYLFLNLRNHFPAINEKHEAGTVPNLSDYFFITQKRTIISKQTTSQLALKDNLGNDSKNH